MLLTVTTAVAAGTATVTAQGELDFTTSPILLDAAREAVRPGVRVVVLDVTDVTFCDSSGLGALVNVHKAAQRAQGRMIVRAPTPDLVRLLEMTGLDTVLTIENGHDDRSADRRSS